MKQKQGKIIAILILSTGRSQALLNLITEDQQIDKIYPYTTSITT